MTILGIIEIALLLLVVPLAAGTAYLLIDEGRRDRKDLRWLTRRQ